MHSHSIADPGHSHSVSDPGHSHSHGSADWANAVQGDIVDIVQQKPAPAAPTPAQIEAACRHAPLFRAIAQHR